MIQIFKNKYFDGDLSAGFVSLYINRTIIYIVVGLLGLYLPIFFYNTFNQEFKYVALYYLVTSILYVAFMAPTVRKLNTFGFRKALQLGVIISALHYVVFYFMDKNTLWITIPLAVITIVIFRVLYWIPYHVDFAKFTNQGDRARQVGMFMATMNMIGIFTPFIAGFILTQFSYDVLFVIAIILFLTSLIPLSTLPKANEKFSWTISETWKEFFSKKRRYTVLAFMADGIESSIGLIVWPIFIYELLQGNYLQIGFISSLIVGATIILQIWVGHLADKKSTKKHILKLGSTLYALGWIFKVFIATAFQIFIIDAYHKLMKIFMRIPFDALTYEIAADQGHYVDEFTVVKEMALHTGRIIAYATLFALSFFVDLHWAFLLAALAAISLNFIRAYSAKQSPN